MLHATSTTTAQMRGQGDSLIRLDGEEGSRTRWEAAGSAPPGHLWVLDLAEQASAGDAGTSVGTDPQPVPSERLAELVEDLDRRHPRSIAGRREAAWESWAIDRVGGTVVAIAFRFGWGHAHNVAIDLRLAATRLGLTVYDPRTSTFEMSAQSTPQRKPPRRRWVRPSR